MSAFRVGSIGWSAAAVTLALCSAGCYYYVPVYDADYDGPGYYDYRPYRSYPYYGYYGYPYFSPYTSLSVDIIGGGHGRPHRRDWGGVPYRHSDGHYRGERHHFSGDHRAWRRGSGVRRDHGDRRRH